jgi:hypothetical protein
MIGLAAPLGAARALDACAGQYSAALLAPLPAPAVIALDVRDNSPDNLALAAAFTRGLQEAGQTVSGAPTVRLSVTYNIMGQDTANNPPPMQQAGGPSIANLGGAGNDAPWLQGGQTAQMPDMPRYDMFTPQQTAQSGLLAMRVQARSTATNAVVWIGSIQCTLQGTDNQALAYQLGARIGGTLGQRVENVPL